MNRPNLLFLYTDEQAFNTLAAYGNNAICMPNLNRLAGSSVVFDEAYVSQPVCTPSRSTLLTGLYPHTNGCTENNVPLQSETPCLPEMMTDPCYVTAHYGKWHLGDELFAQHGFHKWLSIEDGYNHYFSPGRDRNIRSDYHHWLLRNGVSPQKGETFGRGETARLPEELGKPAFLARESAKFLHENRNNPFALYVNFLEPHMPFFGPRDAQYDPGNIPLPPNFTALPDAGQPLKTRLMQTYYRGKGHSGLPLSNENDWRRMIAHYWGLCSLIDTHLGTLLNTLDECGLSDNTIVVFTSDHGDMMGAHGLLAKCVMYQEAIRVPLLMRLPGQTRMQRIHGPVSHIDVVPTILDLMNQATPSHLQGKSLRPWMEGGQPHDHPVFIEWNGPNNGMIDVRGAVKIPDWASEFGTPASIEASCTDPVRTIITPDGWKYNCSPLGEHELYNLRDDPHETRNLVRQETTRTLALREQILAWQTQTGDSAPRTEC